METRHDFRLNFLSNRNELMTLNVPHAESTVAGTQVSDAMLAIINSGVVLSARGEPLFKHSAELVTTNRKDFDMMT